MLIEVKVPALAESVPDATLLNWYKKVGERVERGDNLIDLETDKVTLEVAAPDGGVLSEIRYQTGDVVLTDDILATKSVVKDKSLMGKIDTCLDPSLYDIEKTGAKISLFEGGLNELAPAMIANKSELTLLDVPDALVALQKWPGEIKIIGPVSEEQDMAPAFRKDSPKLRNEFNKMLAEMRADGSFAALVNKYYPFVSDYFPNFLPVKQ